LKENQFHHSRTDLSWSLEVSRNLGCIAVSISATLFDAALDYRSDLGDALAQVTSVCQFVVVNARRGGSRGCARAKPAASADDYHLVDKHRADDSEYGDFFPTGDRRAGRKRPSDLVNHPAFLGQAEFEVPVVKERLYLA
jgi:hypothetical protein